MKKIVSLAAAFIATLLFVVASTFTAQAQTVNYGKVSDYKPTASLAESAMISCGIL